MGYQQTKNEVLDLYRGVMKDVLRQSENAFIDADVDLSVLELLKKDWEKKLLESGSVDFAYPTSKRAQHPNPNSPGVRVTTVDTCMASTTPTVSNEVLYSGQPCGNMMHFDGPPNNSGPYCPATVVRPVLAIPPMYADGCGNSSTMAMPSGAPVSYSHMAAANAQRGQYMMAPNGSPVGVAQCGGTTSSGNVQQPLASSPWTQCASVVAMPISTSPSICPQFVEVHSNVAQTSSVMASVPCPVGGQGRGQCSGGNPFSQQGDHTLPLQRNLPGGNVRIFNIAMPTTSSPIFAMETRSGVQYGALQPQRHFCPAVSAVKAEPGLSRPGPSTSTSVNNVPMKSKGTRKRKAVPQLDGEGMDFSTSLDDEDSEDGSDEDPLKELVKFGDESNDDDSVVVVEEEPLNSDDDQSEDDNVEELFAADNVVVCLCDKVTKVRRLRGRWKFKLRNGMMHIGGKDYFFSRGYGEADW